MNIVRIIFNKKLIVPLIVVGGAVGAVHYSLSPSQALIICDQGISPDVREAVEKYIKKPPLRLPSAQAILKDLQAIWPVVKSVSIAYKSSSQAQVTVNAHKPHLRICSSESGNKEYVLCKTDQPEQVCVIEKKYFSTCITEGMPTVYIEGADFEERRQQPECIDCLKDLKSDVVDEFTITWRSKSEISMQSRRLPMTLIADAVTIHEIERLNAVRRIYENEHERYADGIKADVRLHDSVICSPLKGI